MIAKVTRGDEPGAAVAYLFSAGRHNEHEDPHVIASVAALGTPAGLRPSEGQLKDLEAAMEASSALYGAEVRGGVCWHLALSTKGGVDRDLSDAEWAEVAREAVRRLGFDAGDGQAPCRWVAVRHGRSEAGNDHVHIVVDLVREDGKAASTRNDFKQLSGLCADMERRYGLSAVEGRAKKAAMPGLSRAEQEKAKRTGRYEAEREELARVVRAAATVATSEAELVRLLRGAGLAARPHYDCAGGRRVVGYAVAEEPSDGGVTVFFGGGKLARDLSLPALRARWLDDEDERQEAAVEWGGEAAKAEHETSRAGRHPTYRWAEASERWGKTALREEGPGPVRCPPDGWEKATKELAEVVHRLGVVPPDDVIVWRAVASDAAGALAVLSGRTEPVPGPLARASGLLARSAQGPRQAPGRSGHVRPGALRSVAALMAQADLDEGTPAAWRLLFAELLRAAQAVYDAHVARSEAEQASRLAGEARSALEEARARLGSLESGCEELLGLAELAPPAEVADGRDGGRERRRRGQGGLRPEDHAALGTRRAPGQAQERQATR